MVECFNAWGSNRVVSFYRNKVDTSTDQIMIASSFIHAHVMSYVDGTIFVWGIIFVKEGCCTHKYLKLPLTLNSCHVKFLYWTMMRDDLIT